MFKGSKGFLIADFESRILLPYGDNADLTYYKPRTPDKVLPPLGHFQKQWINACKNGGKTACDFEYSGNMIEQLLLGLVAYRVGKKIEYDGAAGRVTELSRGQQTPAAAIPPGLDAGRLAAQRAGNIFIVPQGVEHEPKSDSCTPQFSEAVPTGEPLGPLPGSNSPQTFHFSVTSSVREQFRRNLFLCPLKSRKWKEFRISGRVIPDPNPELTPEAVREFLTFQYPEMSTATIVGPETTGRCHRYTIQRSIGSKG